MSVMSMYVVFAVNCKEDRKIDI